MKKFLFLFILATGCTLALSAKVQIGDLYYFLDDDNGTATVTWEKFGSKANYEGHASIDIPGKVIYEGKSYRVNLIGNNAFNSCQMTTVVISDNIEKISQDAFNRCTNLSTIIWGKAGSLKEIEQNSFSNCAIESLTIPDGVQTLWNSFCFCRHLKTVVIPASAEAIKYHCFVGCDSLKAIYVDPANPNYCSEDGLLFDKQKTTLLTYPLGRPDRRFSVPESVTRIDDHVFYESGEHLQTVILHAGVKSLGYQTFCFSEVDTIISYAIVPPTIDTETFLCCYAIMYAPDGSCEDYLPVWHQRVYPLSSLPQGLEDVQEDKVQCTKILRDGNIYIRREDKTYNALGAEVK